MDPKVLLLALGHWRRNWSNEFRCWLNC